MGNNKENRMKKKFKFVDFLEGRGEWNNAAGKRK
jgi:hypothetical protein